MSSRVKEEGTGFHETTMRRKTLGIKAIRPGSNVCRNGFQVAFYAKHVGPEVDHVERSERSKCHWTKRTAPGCKMSWNREGRVRKWARQREERVEMTGFVDLLKGVVLSLKLRSFAPMASRAGLIGMMDPTAPIPTLDMRNLQQYLGKMAKMVLRALLFSHEVWVK
ncbi:hypothetical protein ARMSODRAFT_977413 [Armillaria solidipes]|uniref:Uncharacterized protein n=1 Tax=Armillaria solidipes TaxID=1076256 RepID=A0A2H3B6D4_9AGAR|nr:hypothetical protein ARMSODRAFT_977413 [Armillaria solidipes]